MAFFWMLKVDDMASQAEIARQLRAQYRAPAADVQAAQAAQAKEEEAMIGVRQRREKYARTADIGELESIQQEKKSSRWAWGVVIVGAVVALIFLILAALGVISWLVFGLLVVIAAFVVFWLALYLGPKTDLQLAQERAARQMQG